MHIKKFRQISLMFGLGLMVGTGMVVANHPWICSGDTAYTWETTNVKVRNRARGYYKTSYGDAIHVWDDTVINLSGGNKLKLFAGNYGFNGWLGLATISISGCTITSGACYLNNTYLQSYSESQIDHVACQEVGHTFGLDHNREDNDTCMNDTILSAGNQINAHDYEQLEALY